PARSEPQRTGRLDVASRVRRASCSDRCSPLDHRRATTQRVVSARIPDTPGRWRARQDLRIAVARLACPRGTRVRAPNGATSYSTSPTRLAVATASAQLETPSLR